MEIKEIISREEARMDKTIESLKHEFANVRTGSYIFIGFCDG